jgi:drug/metabolite transporter (DMT)-like permease
MKRSEVLQGWGNGLLGVLIFSGSMPATRVAVAGFSPTFLTSARAAIAALLGALLLLLLRQRLPGRDELGRFAIVSSGVVVGFPLLTALALQEITSARSIVFLGLLPLATAAFGVLRGGERPKPAFWFFAFFGSAIVAGFALADSGAGSLKGDLLMLGAIILCGLGYAEGTVLTRRHGGWQVISWALLLSLPIMGPLALATRPLAVDGIATSAWLGLAYVAVFSMFVGFIFWYRGLAIGGTASVGQLQLLQPFFGLTLAAAVLGEQVTTTMMAAALAVVACVALARRFA